MTGAAPPDSQIARSSRASRLAASTSRARRRTGTSRSPPRAEFGRHPRANNPQAIANSISLRSGPIPMRDTLGGRPYEVRKDGSKHVISFYPQAKNAKNPDAVMFRLTLGSDDLKKLAKIAG